MQRSELQEFFNSLYAQATSFKNDYCPNGLQVEGRQDINKIGFAVSATDEIIDKALALNVDTLVTHHGLFWNYQNGITMTGVVGRKVGKLMKNDINLFAYHLPMDGHMEIGHAAQIAQLLGIDISTYGISKAYERMSSSGYNNPLLKTIAPEILPFGDYKGANTGVQFAFKEGIAADQLKERLEGILTHDVIVASPEGNGLIRRVGIITGAAGGEWKTAYQQGLDAFITGEISEHHWSDAMEHGIHLFAGGHGATEVFGLRALLERVQKKFGVECEFISSLNPV